MPGTQDLVRPAIPDGAQLRLFGETRVVNGEVWYLCEQPDRQLRGWAPASYLRLAAVSTGDPKLDTVRAFYQALSDSRFEEAFTLFSPNLQRRLNFNTWKSGYVNTRQVEVLDASLGSGANDVVVDIRSTDIKDGRTEIKRFRGTWTLVWNAVVNGWRLDDANMKPVPDQ